MIDDISNSRPIDYTALNGRWQWTKKYVQGWNGC